VLPRHDGDGVALTWPAKRPPAERLVELGERVRAALAAESRR
jgi:histidine triad (HIT) family protein